MATELKLPELGENIDSGTVVKLLVEAGQKIEKDQPVMELETDKATIEVPSTMGGTVKEVRVQEGQTAKVGEVVLTVEEEAESKEGGQKQVQGQTQEEKKSAPEKAEESKPSRPAEATRKKTTGRKKEKVEKVEKVEEEEVGGESPSEPPGVLPFVPSSRTVPASPSVRRTAREIGIDISEVAGTGPGGRITVEDVTGYARQVNRARATHPALAPVTALPDFSRWGEVERQSMSNIRQKTAEHMAQAWTTVPHVTQFDKADITRLEEQRKQFGSKAESLGGKLTVTAILLKVVTSALKSFPQFNASIDVAKNEVIFKKYYHIGVAVDTERGLLVPVIRDVDRKNILQLAVELNRLAEKARSKKLTLEEMQGGTFTMTNLGGIGGTGFSPIVNYPEVAILGVSRANREPVFVNGSFEPRLMLPLSLSYDHRLIDGADAARFLRWVCGALEEPFLVALEG